MYWRFFYVRIRVARLLEGSSVAEGRRALALVPARPAPACAGAVRAMYTISSAATRALVSNAEP